MKKTNFEKSIEQIEAYLNGDDSHVTIETVYIKEPEKFDDVKVKSVRKKVGLTQRMFSLFLGVSVRTVESWESGRSKPSGPARRLLETIDQQPDIVKMWEK